MSRPDDPRLSVLQKASNGRLAAHGLDRILRDEVRQGAAPALLLVALFVAVFAAEQFTGGPLAWGLSLESLSEGHWETLASHAVAHGGSRIF